MKMATHLTRACVLLLAGVSAAAANASEVYGGVTFPQGSASFADVFVSNTPGTPAPTNPHQGGANALGIPDYAGQNTCPDQPSCSFISLGSGGVLILQFVDNLLTGSGNADDDLWIFEVGPDVEDTFVDVSVDGITWLSVGAVGGSTAGVDLDAFGFGPDSAFAFVRLTDDPSEGNQSGVTVGADIDAVGAISTQLVPAVPEPGSWAMMLGGFGAMGLAFRRRRKVATV